MPPILLTKDGKICASCVDKCIMFTVACFTLLIIMLKLSIKIYWQNAQHNKKIFTFAGKFFLRRKIENSNLLTKSKK